MAMKKLINLGKLKRSGMLLAAGVGFVVGAVAAASIPVVAEYALKAKEKAFELMGATNQGVV